MRMCMGFRRVEMIEGVHLLVSWFVATVVGICRKYDSDIETSYAQCHKHVGNVRFILTLHFYALNPTCHLTFRPTT